MSDITIKINRVFAGYLAFILFLLIIIGSHALFFFMFFLFIYLLTDVMANDLQARYPNISKYFLFYSFYLFLILLFMTISLRIIPEFISDLPTYSAQIQNEINRFIAESSKKYNLNVDMSLLSVKFFDESAKAVKGVVIIFKGISKGFAYFIFALALNFLLFYDAPAIRSLFNAKKGSLMAFIFNFILIRIKKFYYFFKKVMGGQVLISLINTIITSIIVFMLELPHKTTLISLVFICGLLPVIGNIISNTILTITAFFTKGIWAFVICLILLIGIHKLEYFLNSKIIGTIVRLPMFVTLLALLMGESLLGIPGIILAIPAALFIKSELEEIRIQNNE